MNLMARSDMKRRPNIPRKYADFGLPQDFERMTMILSLRKESDRERREGRMIGHHIETDDATFAAFKRNLIIDRVRSMIADLTPERAREVIDQIHFYPPIKHALAASMCGRACDTACYVHLEEKGVLKRKFKTPFRKRPEWFLSLND